MERIWLKSYPADVPAEVDVDAYRSIVDLFEQSVAKFADSFAYIHMGAILIYADVEHISRAFAAYLREVLRLPKGARGDHSAQHPTISDRAVRRAQSRICGGQLQPFFTPRTNSSDNWRILEPRPLSFLKLLLSSCSRRFPGRRSNMSSPRSSATCWGGKGTLVNFLVKYVKRLLPKWSIPNAVRFLAALRKGKTLPWWHEMIDPDDIAFLQYTGGTTGVPKGAVLTHRNIVANLRQHHAFLSPMLLEGRDVTITALPLFHIYALTVSCLLVFKIGAANVLIANPRDIPGLVKELGKHRFTCFPGVNTLFKALVDNPDFARLNFSSLRIAASGGATLQEPVAKQWKAVTGNTLIEAYRLTETSPVVTCNPVDLTEFNGSCGIPIPSTEIAIRNDECADLTIGEAGELCVRGPQVMKGYWNKPEETAKVMTADGFLRTGDIATIDKNGFVRIVDRKKDMINVSGFKVYPNEVEEIASMHPGVLEVGAVGVPHAVSGEIVKIVVVKRDPSLRAEEL